VLYKKLAVDAAPPPPPPPPAPFTNAASLVLPAGTVYVVVVVYVATKAYAGNGITELEAAEASEVPAAFVAVIVNV
jgi:hypothetical protein